MPWCVLPWVQVLWDSLSFLDFLEVYSLCQIGKVLLHYFFKQVFNFLFFFFFWHPYDSDVGMYKVDPEVPKSLLIFLNSCFFILFWLNGSFFLLLQTIDLSPGFLPVTVGSPYILLYFTLGSLHLFLHFTMVEGLSSTISVSILITSVLNCASDRLVISSSLSCIFSGALLCSFIWPVFFPLGVPVT